MDTILRASKWLFICTENMARSPTAEYLARKAGLIARSCGIGANRATRAPLGAPMTSEAIEWADVIVAMKEGHRLALESKYPHSITKGKKVYVWALEDDWGVPYHPEMLEVVERKLLETIQDYERWLEEEVGRRTSDAPLG